MKQKDIVIIAITVFISGIFSYVICSNFLFKASDKKQKAEVVNAITSDFALPDKAIFNTEAINPTQVIQIGPNTNDKPFANRQQ